jgi:D-alanine-D-alanine ligase
MASSPRILVLYNEPVLPPDHPDAATEVEIFDTLKIVSHALEVPGFVVLRLGVGENLRVLLDGLDEKRPDAVFNLFEGLGDRPFTESIVAGVMEWLGVPFTGSPSEALTLARDKRRTKLMLEGAGLPTAPFLFVERLPAPECRLPWPVIVKPALLDCSIGIEQASVVSNQAELERRVAFVLPRYGPVLVERFIPGREFHVFVIEDQRGELLMLPPTEIVFEDAAAWPIYSYSAKWATDSAEFQATPIRPLAALADDLGRRVAEVARGAYRLVGCRDYARVDLRVTPEGEPFILEVNTNPYVGSDGLAEGLAALGRSYEQFLAGVARAALARRAVLGDPRIRQLPTAPARPVGPTVELS